MAYLHEYAEQCRKADAQIERRRADWAAVRADIDRIIRHVRPEFRAAMVQAYKTGFQRAMTQAIPREEN